MEEIGQKIIFLKNWLGTGSINIFGLPMSGKDTVGIRFAELIGAKFLSSGLIIREHEKTTGDDLTGSGALAPTDVFYDLVLPYFSREDLASFPLVLSSVGRWSGEETEVIAAAENSGHEIKAAILLQVSEKDVFNRWETANLLNDRGDRSDDKTKEIFDRRILEFREKTMPVILHYRDMGILVEVNADQDRESVFVDFINKLYNFASTHN
ncbi:nucleoside monophosphate kinase [Candidatus Saccharibacteria bacterium]|nr:nucleoside monophosphate kinase [Candidatus Saccharibacteria bacterium]